MRRAGGQHERAKGRSGSGPRFTRLTHNLMASNAYRALSPNARSLLLELAMMENGRNNGTGLYLSVRDAAARMGVADPNTACAAFAELETLGFIAATAEAHFAVKAGAGSRARYWRLTWEAMHGRMGPTVDYEKREPAPGTAAHKRMDRGLRALKRWRKEQEGGEPNKIAVRDLPTHFSESVGKSHTTASPMGTDPSPSVRDFPTQKTGNGENPPNLVVGDSPTYTADQSGAEESGSSMATVDAALRAPVTAAWVGLTQRGREAFARRAGLTAPEVQRYVDGRDNLSIQKAMALRSAAKVAA